MRRLVVSAVALAALAALPASAQAALTPYPEGPGETPTVRPASGGNTWYWEARNTDPGRNMIVCFRYSIDGAREHTPYDGAPFQPPPPGNLPAHGCGSEIAAGQRVTYRWRLDAPHGSLVRWCATSYHRNLFDVSREAERCSASRIDAKPPDVDIALSDRRGREGATNDPQGLRRTISYADDVSPAWGDTRICRITSRACRNNGSDAFDYIRECSDAPRALMTTFRCGWSWPGNDQRVHQCALSFDSAVGDRAPDLNQPPSAGNPDYSAPGTGNFAIACGSLVIDRTPPQITLHTKPANPRAGERVRLIARARDKPVNGSVGPYRFDFGDGRVRTAKSRVVHHTFAHEGAVSVSIAAPDAAGNRGVSVRGLSIGPPRRLNVRAPKRITRKRRRLAVAIGSGKPGVARLRLVRGQRTLARRTVRFARPGTTKRRLRLPRRLRTGRYRVRATLRPSAQEDAPQRTSTIVRVIARKRR